MVGFCTTTNVISWIHLFLHNLPSGWYLNHKHFYIFYIVSEMDACIQRVFTETAYTTPSARSLWELTSTHFFFSRFLFSYHCPRVSTRSPVLSFLSWTFAYTYICIRQCGRRSRRALGWGCHGCLRTSSAPSCWRGRRYRPAWPSAPSSPYQWHVPEGRASLNE